MERKRLAEAAAKEITKRIHERMWVGRLPGIRPIAAELTVSPSTVIEALKTLEEAGLISPSVAGKRRKILNTPIAPEGDLQSRGVSGKRFGLLLFQKSWDEFEPEEHRFFGLIKERIEAQGAILNYVFCPRVFSLSRPGSALKALLLERPMDFWIVVTPSAPMAKWFSSSEARYLFLGGDHYSLGSTVAHPLSKKVKPAIAALVALGHLRIVMPIPEMWHRNSDEPTGFEVNFQSWLSEHGLRTSSFNCPRFGTSSESLLAMLENTFSLTPPTALIIPSVRDYMCIFGFLQKRGLRVPEDVSLTLLTWEPSVEWIMPKPSHFREENAQLVKRMIQYAVGALRHGNPKIPEAIAGDGVFTQGESVGPVKL